MSTFPGSPKLIKGAIVGIDSTNIPTAVLFQYNPDSLTRSLKPQYTGGGSDISEALRLKGPPDETIKLDIEIDATDQLENGNPVAAAVGISPMLSALELFIYPKSSLVIANEILKAAGTIEIIPLETPLTILIWGPGRIVPVRINDINITEEAFDTSLNPIRAKVSLDFQVLNYNHLGLASRGGALFMNYQILKQVMSALGSVSKIP